MGFFFFAVILPVLLVAFLIVAAIGAAMAGMLFAAVVGKQRPNGLLWLLMSLVSLAAVALVLYGGHRTVHRKLGSRTARTIAISPDAVVLYRTLGDARLATIPRATVRRLKSGNTGTRVEDLPSNTFVSNTGSFSGAAAYAGSSLSRAGRDAWARKFYAVSYTLQLDHGNAATVLADGLDVLTAINLMQDVGRGLDMA